MAASGGAEENLQGWWKVVGWEYEFDGGERRKLHDDEPLGAVVISEGRIAAILTARDRANKDTAGLFQTMLAYSGACRIEQGRLVTRVDVASLPGWVGTEQVRHFELSGDALTITTEWQTAPQFPDRRTRGVVTLRRG